MRKSRTEAVWALSRGCKSKCGLGEETGQLPEHQDRSIMIHPGPQLPPHIQHGGRGRRTGSAVQGSGNSAQSGPRGWGGASSSRQKSSKASLLSLPEPVPNHIKLRAPIFG